ncbi:M24 family metallopeptidase [Thermovibrio sp.]
MKRVERVVSEVNFKGGDYYITFDQAERFYLTGLNSTFGVVLVGEWGSFLFTDGRYLERAKKVKGFQVVEWKGWEEFVKKVREIKGESLVVDPSRLKAETYLKLKEEFRLIENVGFLNPIRSVKDEVEVSLITRAVQIAESAFKSVLHLLKPGITESEFRRELLSAFFKFGGEGEAFPTIVASGPNSAIPHHQTGNREVREGDLVIVDFGTVYGGYASDITRTVLVGKVSGELKELFLTVAQAQELGVSEAKAGRGCSQVDRAVREFFNKKGYGEFFTHSLGHGIGVEVHEAPSLSPRSKEVLRKGNAITVEPGLYLPGVGGIRIEDDCLITEEGAFKLSNLPVEV